MEEADDAGKPSWQTDSHLHDLINYADKFVAAYAEHQRLEAGKEQGLAQNSLGARYLGPIEERETFRIKRMTKKRGSGEGGDIE